MWVFQVVFLLAPPYYKRRRLIIRDTKTPNGQKNAASLSVFSSLVAPLRRRCRRQLSRQLGAWSSGDAAVRAVLLGDVADSDLRPPTQSNNLLFFHFFSLSILNSQFWVRHPWKTIFQIQEPPKPISIKPASNADLGYHESFYEVVL